MDKIKLEKYNTRVRQAMSDKYVECTKEKCSIGQKMTELYKLLTSKEGKQLPYSEYKMLEVDYEYYTKEHDRKEIELDIWDMAREICLNVADDVFDEE